MRRIRIILLLCILVPLSLCAQTLHPVAETRDNPTIIRSGPSQDFDRIVELPKGLRLPVLAVEGDWTRVELSGTLSGWVESGSLLMLPLNANAEPSHPVIRNIKITRESRDVRMEILESEPGVVIPGESLFPSTLRLRFENAQSAIFEIDYSPKDPLIREISVRQETSDEVVVTIHLKSLYGYRFIQKDPTHFLVKFRLPPRVERGRGVLFGWRICLDPGHGGKDTGAVGPTGLEEKDVTLSIAKMLGEMLRARGASVFFTRTTDAELLDAEATAERELEARVNVARRVHANLFVSIHCNARPTVAEGRVASGTYVYYFQPASLKLAWDMARSLEAETREPKYGVIFRSFHVIREPDMPAVLAETVFISNPITEERLRNIAYRRRIAYGLLRGILRYAASH